MTGQSLGSRPSARRVIVTGAGGFVGANVCRRLLRDGHEVHAVVRPGADTWRLTDVEPHLAVRRLDVRDDDAVRTAVAGIRADWLFHLAAHGAYSWQTGADTIIAVNVRASAGLADLAGAGAFEAYVQAGSTAEYGHKNHPADETEPADPVGCYATSKAAATRYARSVSMASGAHIVTLRLATAYGFWEEPARLMPTLAMFGLRRRLPPLTDPRTVRDFVFIEDVCDAIIRAACAVQLERGSVFNIGSGRPTSLAELVGLARAVLDIDQAPSWSTMDPRPWEGEMHVADCRRSRRRLGWRPRRTLADGFRALSDWLQTSAPHHARYARAIGLPFG